MVSWIDTVCIDGPNPVPVTSRFQAVITNQTVSRAEYEQDFDAARFQGTAITIPDGREEDDLIVGIGRPKWSCSCEHPESVKCNKRHSLEKKNQLRRDFGAAFQASGIDNVGEDVAKMWTEEEENRFQRFVKSNLIGNGLTAARKAFPSKSRKEIISYYYNVHVPRRMTEQRRLGFKEVDTDDEGEGRAKGWGKRKRSRATVLKGKKKR